ncbi:MAG: VWA domain-containing protein, partial [Chloroflexota bacterium]
NNYPPPPPAYQPPTYPQNNYPPPPPAYQPPTYPQNNYPPPPSKAVSLEKRLEKEAPHLVNLSKTLGVTLEKKGLQHMVAKVALVMDASGSMSSAYKKGVVQAIMDRVTLVAARMDDDGSLETWFYGSKHRRFPDITVGNISGYITHNVKGGALEIVKGLGAGNNEPPVMQEVVNTYWQSNLPVLVIFITDGGISQGQEIKKILMEASRYPIFWQFVGVAGSSYGVLKDFDTMQGRVVDNANFFQVDDLARISDSELYDRMLNEFPGWLLEIKSKGILL